MTASSCILKERRSWRSGHHLSPREINQGSCLVFATRVAERLEGASVIWNDEFDHAYVRWQGRLYDSETPRGVRRWTQLPAVRRQRI